MSVYVHLRWKTKSRILNEAVEIDNYELVNKVIEDMRPDNRTKKLALSIALKKGLYKISKLLIDNIDEDINIEYTQDDNTNLLESAVMSGNLEVVRLLFKKGIDVKNNTKAIIEALNNSDTIILNLLLANGADVKNNYIPNLFDIAYDEKDYDAIKLLIGYGADPKMHDDVYLWYMVCEVLKKLGKDFDEKEIFKIISEPGDTDYLLLHEIIDE